MTRRELTREEVARLRHGVDQPALEELLGRVPPEVQDNLLRVVLRPVPPPLPLRAIAPKHLGEALEPLWSYALPRAGDTRFVDDDALQALYERATRHMV
jgi:hypothetical protein